MSPLLPKAPAHGWTHSKFLINIINYCSALHCVGHRYTQKMGIWWLPIKSALLSCQISMWTHWNIRRSNYTLIAACSQMGKLAKNGWLILNPQSKGQHFSIFQAPLQNHSLGRMCIFRLYLHKTEGRWPPELSLVKCIWKNLLFGVMW